jgi:hypothetical protein
MSRRTSGRAVTLRQSYRETARDGDRGATSQYACPSFARTRSIEHGRQT